MELNESLTVPVNADGVGSFDLVATDTRQVAGLVASSGTATMELLDGDMGPYVKVTIRNATPSSQVTVRWYAEPE